MPRGTVAILVAENADRSPAYLERVRGEGYLSVPFATDMERSTRLA